MYLKYKVFDHHWLPHSRVDAALGIAFLEDPSIVALTDNYKKVLFMKHFTITALIVLPL